MGHEEEAIGAYEKSLSFNSFQEEAHINLARIRYARYQTTLDSALKEDVIERLNFVLSVNPNNRGGQQLLEIMKGDEAG